MNVRSAAFEGGKDGGIDQPDDGADVLFGSELLDRDVLIGIVFGRDDVEREALRRLVEHPLRLLRLLEQVGDLREGGHPGGDPLSQQAADLVQHHEAAGIADRDDQAVFQLLQGHEVITKHHVDGHAAEKFVLDAKVLEVDKIAAIAMGERLGARGLV